jgi:hypothetical protein
VQQTVSAVPQEMQKRAPSAFSRRQEGHVLTRPRIGRLPQRAEAAVLATCDTKGDHLPATSEGGAAMPHGWTIIFGTPASLADLWDRPDEFKAVVSGLLEETQSGSVLSEVYFHWRKNAHEAYVLIDFPDDVDRGEVVATMQEKFESDKVYFFLSTDEKQAQLAAEA